MALLAWRVISGGEAVHVVVGSDLFSFVGGGACGFWWCCSGWVIHITGGGAMPIFSMSSFVHIFDMNKLSISCG